MKNRFVPACTLLENRIPLDGSLSDPPDYVPPDPSPGGGLNNLNPADMVGWGPAGGTNGLGPLDDGFVAYGPDEGYDLGRPLAVSYSNEISPYDYNSVTPTPLQFLNGVFIL